MQPHRTPVPLAEPLQADVADPALSWAHASGWAQLSGIRHTVSCVLACRNQALKLANLLPVLSDMLTDCGYPWEIIAIDVASVDETPSVLAAWTELPGFHALALRPGANACNALAMGLSRARGDAIILIDVALFEGPAQIPRMVLQWEAGARLVFAVREPVTGASRLERWDDADVQALPVGREFHFPSQATVLGLVDRGLLTTLMQGS